MSSAISPQSLIDRACASTGLDDLGSAHFRDVLAAWCRDLDSPRLSEAGRAAFTRLAIRNLETRLRVQDTLRRHPEIVETALPRIVRIAGFPRSGTTLLHQLMSLGTNRRALLRWELVAPVPPPEASTYSTDPRIGKVNGALDSLRGSELERMHWVEATDPEECTWGFLDLTGLLGRGCVGAMPTWADLIYDHRRNPRDTYVEYRRLVQLLLWRNAPDPGAVLVLKSPMDTDCLPAFLDVFSEAAVVLIHRDPFRTVTSGCRMQQIINAPYLVEGRLLSDEENVARVMAIQASQAKAMVDLAHHRPAATLSIRYSDLMSDPADVVADLGQRLGLIEAPDTVRNDVHAFLERQRAGARAAPPAALPTFDTTPDAIRADPSMARYMSTFGVREEYDRISSPRS